MYCPKCGSFHDETLASQEQDGKLPPKDYRMILNNGEVLNGKLITCHNYNQRFVVSELPYPSINEMLVYIRNGKQIQAIKIFRDETGLGLKDAKDCVDFIRDKLLK